MNSKTAILALCTLSITACTLTESGESKKENIMTPPIAQTKPETLSTHGDQRIDEYYWMRLSDEQKENGEADPQTKKVLEYLRAENDYTEEVLKDTENLQDSLYEEMIARLDPTDQSVPYLDNGYYYYSRYEEGAEYPLHCRKEGSLDSEEEVMLNEAALAEGHDYYSIAGKRVSSNNKLIAYAEDTLSRRIYTIRFKNLETGEWYDDQIPGTSGNMVWANDNKTVFYATRDEALRSFKIFKHTLGTPVEQDEEVFHEADETFRCFVYKSKSDQFLIISSNSTVSDEYRVLNADTPNGDWRIVQPRERGLEYQIDHYGGHFYVLTNWEATNFRLMKTPVDQTEKPHWVEVIPHRENALIENMELFKDYLVLEERTDGLAKVRVIPWSGKGDHYIQFEDAAYVSGIGTNKEFNTDKLRIGYSSLVTPNSVYDYDMSERALELMKQQKVMTGYNSDEYKSERMWVTARDGAKVPVSLVYKKDLFEQNGQSPLLLYGYGSYGASNDPYFRSTMLSLLDRGFVFALAHIRGGQEMGRMWYEDGKMLNKINTFNDFIDCGEYLVDQKYCAPDQLHAMGGSAGGLLVGAVMNMRPDLWKGVVAAVPFVDVVTTMLDETIPLTTGEYDEWGNPNEEEYYMYMKSYSPYDNVRPVDYPNVLVTTGYWDSQVQYWEPAKWVARLRAVNTGDKSILLHTNLEAGHGGASGRYQRYREVALEYAFLLDLAGLTDQKKAL